MKRPRILIAECQAFPTIAAQLLSQVAEVILADLTRDELLAAVGSVDMLWVRLRHRLDAEVMDAAPHLRLIVTPTTGLNHIDLEEASRRNIEVLCLRGETEFLKDVRATAELTIGLMLAIIRRIPAAAAHVLHGGWNRNLFKGNELFGKTAGVIGYGRLGRIVARYLRAFDMRVLASDPNVSPDAVEEGARLVPLDQLLAASDIVTLHVNYSTETHGFFGFKQFEMMKPGAWFINTSRGELVDEIALWEALQSGRIAGAALDVICNEGADDLGDRSLIAYARTHDNLIIMPHIGGGTYESLEKTECFLAEKFFNRLQPCV